MKCLSSGLTKTSDVIEYSQKKNFDSYSQGDTNYKDCGFLVGEEKQYQVTHTNNKIQ